jgi:hypothetical protein
MTGQVEHPAERRETHGVKVTIHHVRLGPEEFRVVRAAEPLTHAMLADHDRRLQMSLDAETAHHIGVLWLLAARSPRSLIHLPLRGGALPVGEPPPGARLDLVLAHHSLGFRPHHWKRLRARLGDGAPGTVRVPRDERAADHAVHHRENRDLFHQHVHAETLFMIGSGKVFRATAGRFFEVAEHGPRADSHYCTEFHRGDGVLGNAREIHVEYAGRWTH